MCLLYPVAGPIAKLLDYILHGDGDEVNAYSRRLNCQRCSIQYEDRLANKARSANCWLEAEAVVTGGHLFAERSRRGAISPNVLLDATLLSRV
jgi:hypothetical protein